MTNSNYETPALQEFKGFVSFLKNLWGILAGITVIFPLSNVLAKVIPLKKWAGDAGTGAFYVLSPTLVSVVATLCALFIILWMFINRSDLNKKNARLNQRKALRCFLFGILCLIGYLVLYYLVSGYEIYWSLFNWTGDDPRRIIGDFILLVLFCGFFALVTRAFVLLGMIEFFARKKKHQNWLSCLFKNMNLCLCGFVVKEFFTITTKKNLLPASRLQNNLPHRRAAFDELMGSGCFGERHPFMNKWLDFFLCQMIQQNSNRF